MCWRLNVMEPLAILLSGTAIILTPFLPKTLDGPPPPPCIPLFSSGHLKAGLMIRLTTASQTVLCSDEIIRTLSRELSVLILIPSFQGRTWLVLLHMIMAAFPGMKQLKNRMEQILSLTWVSTSLLAVCEDKRDRA